jgi:hypothetical protein
VPLISLNTLDVIHLQVAFPRHGAWRGLAFVDAADAADLTGALTLDVGDGQLTLTGRSGAVGAWQDAVRVELIGGRGALATIARARHYDQPTVQRIASDLLGDAGETLSSTSEAALLALTLPRWTTLAQPVGAALDLLVEGGRAGDVWRVLADGDVYLGAETWPDAAQEGDLLLDDPQERRALVGVDVPLLLPGTTYADGRQISRVAWEVTGDGARCMLWFEP